MFATFLKRINSNAGHLGHLSHEVHLQENVTEVLSKATPAVPIVNVVLLGLDFVRIPLIYAAARITGLELPPFKLSFSKPAKWFYSAILLALPITALALPAAAPIIAISIAAITLAGGLITMGKIINDRIKHRKEQKELEHIIGDNTRKLELFCQEALALEEQISSATPKEIDELSLQLTQKRTDFGTLLTKNNIDLQKKFNCDQELKKKGMAAMMDKGVSLSLACLGFAALVTSLFIPPLGLSLVLGTVLLGATYFLGRITTPLIKTLFTRMFGTKPVATHSGDSQKDHDLPDSNQAKHTIENQSPTIADEPEDINTVLIKKGATITNSPALKDSTAKTIGLLTPPGMVTPMHHQSPWLAEIQSKLSMIAETHNLTDVATFFTQLAWHTHVKYPDLTTAELSEFFNNLEDTKPAFMLLKQAIHAIQANTLELSQTDRAILLNCQPLIELLHTQDIHLEALSPPIPAAPRHSNEDEREGEGDGEGDGEKPMRD